MLRSVDILYIGALYGIESVTFIGIPTLVFVCGKVTEKLAGLQTLNCKRLPAKRHMFS